MLNILDSLHTTYTCHSLYSTTYCYDLKLGSDCNSGKDLSKNEGNDQFGKA